MTGPSDIATRIPDKLYFKIGEVSRIAEVPPSVLRFWENEFPRIKPKRTDAGQRLYRKNHVALILTIKHLLYDRKFTIQGARQYLNRPQPLAQEGQGRGDIVQEVRNALLEIRKLLE